MEKNVSKAKKYFKIAADNGNVCSMFQLAEIYHKASKKNKKFKRNALTYYKKASDSNNHDATFKLAKIKMEGKNRNFFFFFLIFFFFF